MDESRRSSAGEARHETGQVVGDVSRRVLGQIAYGLLDVDSGFYSEWDRSQERVLSSQGL